MYLIGTIWSKKWPKIIEKWSKMIPSPSKSFENFLDMKKYGCPQLGFEPGTSRLLLNEETERTQVQIPPEVTFIYNKELGE